MFYIVWRAVFVVCVFPVLSDLVAYMYCLKLKKLHYLLRMWFTSLLTGWDGTLGITLTFF